MNEKLKNDSKKNWIFAEGFKWRMYPTGDVVIQLLPLLSSAAADEDNIVRHIIITPTQIDDLSLEITILQADSYMPICTLDIMLKRPTGGASLAGLRLEAEAATWKATGTTDESGHMTLTGPLEHQINQLTFRVKKERIT